MKNTYKYPIEQEVLNKLNEYIERETYGLDDQHFIPLVDIEEILYYKPKFSENFAAQTSLEDWGSAFDNKWTEEYSAYSSSLEAQERVLTYLKYFLANKLYKISFCEFEPQGEPTVIKWTHEGKEHQRTEYHFEKKIWHFYDQPEEAEKMYNDLFLFLNKEYKNFDMDDYRNEFNSILDIHWYIRLYPWSGRSSTFNEDKRTLNYWWKMRLRRFINNSKKRIQRVNDSYFKNKKIAKLVEDIDNSATY